MRPFGYPLTILNTLDPLGKFDGKSDEGYLLRYSTTSKAFRVYNKRTKRVEENMHIDFLEDQLNMARNGPDWMFDLDFLTNTMNYIPVSVENQVNVDAVEDVVQAAQEKPSENFPKDNDVQNSEDVVDKEEQHTLTEAEQALKDDLERMIAQEIAAKAIDDATRQAFEEEKKKAAQTTSINKLNTGRPSVSTSNSPLVSTANTPYASTANTPTGANTGGSSFVYLGGQIPIDASTLPNIDLPIDPNMPDLEDDSNVFLNDVIFSGAYDDEDVGAKADFNNMDNTIDVSPIPTLRIHKDHPKEEPKTISQALEDESWVEAMQEELLQFKLQKVWILVNLPFGKKAIDTKWVFRNKKDERSIVVKNKVRLVTQGFKQEEGIEYDEVFAPVARIKAIRLFLAFASFMEFPVYQMDVKSTFLYGTIEEEVYVHQPPGFVDPVHPNKVYKVIKALYGLHQAPRAWYETLSSFLLENGFRRGTIDKTLFIKKNKSDIMLVKVYVDDIIFGSTTQSMCTEFEDYKYVADILKKFDFCSIKIATTPIVSNKPLVKDEDGVDVDVHIYRSMIGSLMYLTASRPDIMFAIYACARDSPFELEAFSDSDYRGASLDRKSPTSGCQFPLNQMMDYGFNFMNTKIHTDNESTICIVKNPVYHLRTKHIKIRHHFIRDCYEKRLIDVIKIHTDANGRQVSRLRATYGVEIVSAASLVNTVRLTLSTARLISMGNLEFVDQLNMVACLEKTEGNSDFHEIVYFLASSSIHHALTVSPPIYTSYIEQFWNTASSQIVNDVKQIITTVDSKAIVVIEASIRSSLLFNGADGTACLTNEAIFQNLALMGYEGDFNKLTFQKALFSPQWKDQTPKTSPSHATIQDSRDSLQETKPYDSPLLGGHTSTRAEGALNLQELFVLCTNLSNRVLSLESIKDAQVVEINALKIRIKRLEKKCKPSISHHREWLKSVQRLSIKKRFGKKEYLSKQGRKKSKPESTLDNSTVFDNQDTDHVVEDKGSGDKGGNAKELVSTARPEVSTPRPDIDAARQEDSVVEPRTPLTTISIFDDEAITMAQILIKMKEEKAKEKGVSIKDVDDSSRPKRSILTLKPLPTIDPKDKGKGVLKESPVKKVKRSDLDAAQIAKDAEIARLIHEKELAKMEREIEERQREDQASVDYIASLYDEVQAKMDASEELAARLQMEEREMYTIEERSKLLAKNFERRKKLLAEERVVTVRNKPPTRTQLRSLMMTYLKHTGKYRHNQLNKKTFEEIQALYIKEQERDVDFVPIGSERDEKMIDKMNKKSAGMDEEEVPEELKSTKVEVKKEGREENIRKRSGRRLKMKATKKSKRQKTDSDLEEEEQLRASLKIVPDIEEEIDYEVLGTRYPIVNLESAFYHTDRYGVPHDYYKVFRANGSS
ncbi:putative ribonuclease H-like domain-containing protein, partial [Tanacetum coccineum]